MYLENLLPSSFGNFLTPQKVRIFLVQVDNAAGSALMMPLQVEDGVFAMLSPTPSGSDKVVPWIAANEDTGPLVKGIVASPPSKNLIAYRENVPPEEAMNSWARINNVKVQALETSRDKMVETMGEELGAEIWDTFVYIKDYGFAPEGDPDCVYPEAVSNLMPIHFDSWLTM